jgi:hypothetical protein
MYDSQMSDVFPPISKIPDGGCYFCFSYHFRFTLNFAYQRIHICTYQLIRVCVYTVESRSLGHNSFFCVLINWCGRWEPRTSLLVCINLHFLQSYWNLPRATTWYPRDYSKIDRLICTGYFIEYGL